MQSLVDMFPHFYDKSEDSNFFKSQSVTNNVFKGIFQSISEVSDSLRLRKRCFIWKEQDVPYDYLIHFVVNYPNLKSVRCYKNDALLYMEEYSEEDNVDSFMYSYDSSEDNSIVSETIMDNEVENQEGEDEEEIDIPIIPEDTFHIIAEAYDEIIIKKGFPENDEILGNIYDHDESLDEIGALHDIPRKTYIPTEDYAHTEPPYNNRLTEDDYHYMNRILYYTLHLHDTPLPVLEIWKMYGIFSDMVNREQYLLKMFDETRHPFDPETGHVLDWTPMPWEHKDRLCDLQQSLGRFFFVSANTLLPVKDQAVKFNFKYLNSLAEKLTGDYNVTITLQGEEEDEDIVLVENYPGEQYTVNSDLLQDDTPNVFVFDAYNGDDLFDSQTLTVNVRGCNTGDWYVSSNGSDSAKGDYDNPFATLDKALSMINGEENLIVVTSGTYTTDHTLDVPYSCTVLGCGNPVINNTAGLKFFRVYQNQTLNLQDISLTHDTSNVVIDNSSWSNNNKNNNPFYVVISEGAGKITTVLSVSADKSSYLTGETIRITGVLTDNEETGVSGKSIKIYVNNTLVDTVTTQGAAGSFSKDITASTAGGMVIRAVFEGDGEYYSSTESISVTVSEPVPASISVTSDKPIMQKGEQALITATVLDANGNPCVGETVSFAVVDGESLGSDVTDASGEASVYYLGKGTGDLYIQADCGIISSKIYIEDLYKYVTDFTDWSGTSPIYSDFLLPANHEITVKAKATPNFQIACSDQNSHWIYAQNFGHLNNTDLSYKSYNSDTGNATKRLNLPLNTTSEYKIQYVNYMVSIYKDDTLIVSQRTYDPLSITKYVRIYNNAANVDWLKIREL